MSCLQAIEESLKNLPREFDCEMLDEKTWLVTTPFEYPDGDLIQLYVVKINDKYEVTDFAETIRLFETLDFDVLSSKRRKKLFEDILRTYKVEFFKGELKVKVQAEELLKSILNLSQAIFRVSDLYFLQRLGVTTTFKEEVEEVLREADLDYEVDYSIFGKSGKEYKVDFYIDVVKPNLLEAISTYSREYAERLIDRVVRMWYDIKRLDGRFEYVTIVDDRSDVWKKEHFDLLEDLSKVYVWSEIEDYITEIT